jgi:hypothetical protein
VRLPYNCLDGQEARQFRTVQIAIAIVGQARLACRAVTRALAISAVLSPKRLLTRVSILLPKLLVHEFDKLAVLD